jgi:hypothetical protein
MRPILTLCCLLLLAGCADPMPTTGTTIAFGAKAPQGAVDKKPGAPAAPAVERKIIYTATIDIDVKDVDATATEVAKVADECGGYVAKSDISGQVGRSRRATWTLKVKAAKFTDAVDRLLALGEVTRKATDSQDVTEEFVDAEARLKNYRAEEAKLNELLEKAVGKVEDLLKVREQIKVVRGEIERVEGRLKYLTAMTDFSTITVTAREEIDYTPKSSGESLSFGEQAKARLANSWDGLVRATKAFALWCVEITPFLPVIAVSVLVAWLLLRRLMRALMAAAKG